MSHFAVMVIGDGYEAQLEPYAEDDDEYYAFVDRSDEVRERWENREKEPGLAKYGDIDSLARGYYGYKKHEGRYGYWANPNGKWDWYQLGGRWTGFLPIKAGVPADRYRLGEPSALTPRRDLGNVADQARLGDIDFERARDDAEKEARALFSKWRKCFEAHSERPESWSAVLDRFNKSGKEIAAARNFYHSQHVIQLVKEERIDPWLGCIVEELGFDEEAYVAKMRALTLIPHAVVHEGKWYERGSVGMFGTTYDEMSDQEWVEKFNELITGLSEDTLISVVDCHT